MLAGESYKHRVYSVGHLTLFPINHVIISETSYNLDASGKKVAGIFRAKSSSATYSHVWIRGGGNVTSGAGNVTYKVSLQTVTASASSTAPPTPSGTILQLNYGGDAAKTVIHTSVTDDILQFTFPGSDAVTLVEGDYVAIVIEYVSGPIGASNYAAFKYQCSAVTTSDFGFPVPLLHNGTSWAAGSGLPMMSVANNTGVDTTTDGGTPIMGINVVKIADVSLTSTGTNRKIGTFWHQPFYGELNSFIINAKFADETTTFDIELYRYDALSTSSYGTLVNSASYSSANVSSDWSNFRIIYLPFPTSKLYAWERYTALIKATTTDAVTVKEITCPYYSQIATTIGSDYMGFGAEARETSTTTVNYAYPTSNTIKIGLVVPVIGRVAMRMFT